MHKLHSKHLKTKSKFRARIRRIRSLSPSKIVTRFRRVRLTGQIHKIHLPKPSTAHQEYRMLKNVQWFSMYTCMCVSCVCVCVDANQQERQGGARSAVLMCQQQRTRSDASGRAFSKWDLADLALKLLQQQLVLHIFTKFAATADKIDLPTSSAETTPSLWSLAAVLRLLLRCKGATALPWKTS